MDFAEAAQVKVSAVAKSIPLKSVDPEIFVMVVLPAKSSIDLETIEGTFGFSSVSLVNRKEGCYFIERVEDVELGRDRLPSVRATRPFGRVSSRLCNCTGWRGKGTGVHSIGLRPPVGLALLDEEYDFIERDKSCGRS